MRTNKEKHPVINEIITELATGDEEGSLDNQTTVIENYKKYSPTTQKMFVSHLIEEYKKQSSEIKEKCAETLFSAPYGNVYKPKDKEKNKIQNTSNNVIATIETIDRKEILTITSTIRNTVLLTYPLVQSIMVSAFSESGKNFAFSYERKFSDTETILVISTRSQTTKNMSYIPKIYSVKNSLEIIGLLFLDDFTLLTLDKDYSMTVINLPENTKV